MNESKDMNNINGMMRYEDEYDEWKWHQQHEYEHENINYNNNNMIGNNFQMYGYNNNQMMGDYSPLTKGRSGMKMNQNLLMQNGIY